MLVVWDEPMHGIGRPWLLCSHCRGRCRHVYLPELACRRCLHLDFSCRHLRRQTPGVGRVERLRRTLGGHLCQRGRQAVLRPITRGWWRRSRRKSDRSSRTWARSCTTFAGGSAFARRRASGRLGHGTRQDRAAIRAGNIHVPAARVQPVGELFWFVDQAAAGEGQARGRAMVGPMIASLLSRMDDSVQVAVRGSCPILLKRALQITHRH